MTRGLALVVGLGWVVGCGNGNSPLMRPGEDCLRCHDGDRAPRWTAAGTVYGDENAAADQGIRGVTVVVIDSSAKAIELVSNAAGNFYTAETLTPPLDAYVEKDGVRIDADAGVGNGACNTCHGLPPTDQADGRLFWRAD